MLANVPAFKVEDILEGVSKNQIFLIAQPQVELETLSLKGFEFLARWKHPKYGELSPYHFIPILENERRCHHLTLYLFENLLELIVTEELPQDGPIYSLNISALDLHCENFASKLTSLLCRYNVHPSCLMLEVTETSSIFNNESIACLRSIHSLGIKLAIDDFWTGFSTLETIRIGVFSEIKIDYTLTSKILRDKASLAGVNAILQLSSDLGLNCVVEGVEDCFVRSVLIESGAIYGQGYLFHRGVSVSNLKEWIQSYSKQSLGVRCSDSEIALTKQECTALESRKHPSWTWDFGQRQITWANEAALRLWDSDSVDDLYSRDFTGMSYLVKVRLESYRRRFRSGEEIICSEWDFYPKDEHKKVYCLQVPRYLEDTGRIVMLVHAYEGYKVRLPERKFVESANTFPAPFIVVDEEGHILRVNKYAHIEINVKGELITDVMGASDFNYIRECTANGGMAQIFARAVNLDGIEFLYVRSVKTPNKIRTGSYCYHMTIIPVTDLIAVGLPDVSN
ncbi:MULTISPECIES: EAL domain-containing protein [Pseudoalteromonas]|uniref:EAL domain-containing protein n=1 Tax=Pseudoalteromonas TaxID=53246 RepID=UPI0015824AB7|nr:MULTISPECIES: EAL domain-containing protein [Pseudoalteromonas]MDI4650765.1 EAL domain-containing protein [Pseudoalteromonas shioyasakiensis]NUJ37186.1 EAL domain-containing protein [Pseudoalteromonas sp. 0303]